MTATHAPNCTHSCDRQDGTHDPACTHSCDTDTRSGVRERVEAELSRMESLCSIAGWHSECNAQVDVHTAAVKVRVALVGLSEGGQS